MAEKLAQWSTVKKVLITCVLYVRIYLFVYLSLLKVANVSDYVLDEIGHFVKSGDFIFKRI